MKKGIVLGMMILLIPVLGNPALAVTTWYLGGYGKYSAAWGGLNDTIRNYNSWTQDLGLTDFEMEELDDESVYSLGSTWELSPRWEIEWNALLFNPGEVSESQEKTFSLDGGAEKWLKAESQINYFMTLSDLTGRYFFSSSSKLSPFIEAGLTYCTGSFSGLYLASEEVHTPPQHEYRNFNQDFSVHDSKLGYVLGAGIDYSLGKHFRMGLKLEHHWVPSIKCQVETYNEGFSSSPVGPEIEIDQSGMSYGLYLMFRF